MGSILTHHNRTKLSNTKIDTKPDTKADTKPKSTKRSNKQETTEETMQVTKQVTKHVEHQQLKTSPSPQSNQPTFTENVQALPKDWVGNLTGYTRLETLPVAVGNLVIGGANPIRIQSMTTASPDDINGLVAEIEELYRSGAELVRLTVPSLKAVRSLEKVKIRLDTLKLPIPLVADVHFTPNAALAAAEIVEKVRINPGNYVDKKRFSETILSPEAYKDELKRLEEKCVPLLTSCQKHGTALRIGVNHGSLSDRIVNKYGDSPYGMVQSALEFLTIAENHHFEAIVLSMKSSNPVTMTHAYRLLVYYMKQRGKIYPLHLGVTEAGDGQLGRIKSATGMAALLCDGIGDTIRVSLTEDAIHELPVCKKIRATSEMLQNHPEQFDVPVQSFHFYDFARRESLLLDQLGAEEVPKVFVSSKKPLHNPLREPEREELYQLGLLKHRQRDEWDYSDTAPDGFFVKNLTEAQALPAALHKIIPYKDLSTLSTLSPIAALDDSPDALPAPSRISTSDHHKNDANHTDDSLANSSKTYPSRASVPKTSAWKALSPYLSLFYQTLAEYLTYRASVTTRTSDYNTPKTPKNPEKPGKSQFAPISHYIRIGLSDLTALQEAFDRHPDYFHNIVWVVTAETKHFALECRTVILALMKLAKHTPHSLPSSASQHPNIHCENSQTDDNQESFSHSTTHQSPHSPHYHSDHTAPLGKFPILIYWDGKPYLKENVTEHLAENSIKYSKKQLSSEVDLKSSLIMAAAETRAVEASFALGPLLIDGLIDGVYLGQRQPKDLDLIYAIFQATRRRISKVDYISCPSCGRTLFDLQEITAKIKQRTAHLKHVKIGIMGCIVNGPGEMADADYGYVGSGVGKVSLYKGKEIIRRSIPETEAVDALVALIRQYGQWSEPSS